MTKEFQSETYAEVRAAARTLSGLLDTLSEIPGGPVTREDMANLSDLYFKVAQWADDFDPEKDAKQAAQAAVAAKIAEEYDFDPFEEAE